MQGETIGAATSRLARLADKHGIESGYDMQGEHVIIPPDTQIRLLAAMGITAEAETASSLEAPAAADEEPAVPPVVVARSEDGCCSVELSVTSQVRRVAWHLQLEDGADRRGTITLEETLGSGQARGSERRRVVLKLPDVPWGYHKLHLPELQATVALCVTPGRCWLPPFFDEGARSWGLAVQLYLVRSTQNWGIGDFADLATIVSVAAQRGCVLLGLNPLHQMFLDSPEKASPYSPLSRLYLNALYIAVPDAPGYAECAELRELTASEDFTSRLQACREAPAVDYTAVTSLKVQALRLVYAAFRGSPLAESSGFDRFRAEHGARLRLTSTFQLLRQHLSDADAAMADWHAWPAEYRDCSSKAVACFAAQHSGEIEFLAWLQWVADEQLAAAACAARQAGMSIGLYRDLAVGCSQFGAETWADPQVFLAGTSVGAPPDVFNPAGQNWGIAPFQPDALRKTGYLAFIELVRSNMRHAGALRIDHVMGLQRLFCIPEGCVPTEGAYLRYPLEDLIGILALESHRHQCLLVGEDLGTVPESFRQSMAGANILSYRVLFFEQDWTKGSFLSPSEYPRLAVAVAGSHDLPTLRAWWQARDVQLKESLGLFPSEADVVSQRQQREVDQAALVRALSLEGLVPADREVDPDQFAIAAHEFLARSQAALVICQLDDLLGETDQVNVPGTDLQNLNWRRKYSVGLQDMGADVAWRLTGDLAKLRKPTPLGAAEG